MLKSYVLKWFKKSHLAHEIRSWKKRKIVPKYSFLCSKSRKLQIIYHNIQSLTKHEMLVKNDKVFMNSDLVILGETWSLPKDSINLHNFHLIAKTNSGHIRKPKGISVSIKNRLLKEVTESTAYQIKDTKGSIDIGIVKLKSLTIIGIYASPKVCIPLWHKFFNSIKTTLNKKLIIVGDFNLNHMKLKKNSFIYNTIQKCHLEIKNKKMATTHNNTGIDWILSNTHLKCGTYNSFFSHHYPLWIRKAYGNLPEDKNNTPSTSSARSNDIPHIITSMDKSNDNNYLDKLDSLSLKRSSDDDLDIELSQRVTTQTSIDSSTDSDTYKNPLSKSLLTNRKKGKGKGKAKPLIPNASDSSANFQNSSASKILKQKRGAKRTSSKDKNLNKEKSKVNKKTKLNESTTADSDSSDDTEASKKRKLDYISPLESDTSEDIKTKKNKNKRFLKQKKTKTSKSCSEDSDDSSDTSSDSESSKSEKSDSSSSSESSAPPKKLEQKKIATSLKQKNLNEGGSEKSK
ncbi:TRIO and F-actin-binding protein, partial [Frankliniella fusca]